MTDERERAARAALGATHTRRDVLKGAAAAAGGALALAALGGHLAAPVAAASPAIAAAQDELLPESKIVLGSAIAVSLTNHSVTLPLRQGVFNGQPTRNPNER